MQRTRSVPTDFDSMAAVDPVAGAGGSSAAEEEASSSSWVPVRAVLLTNLSRDLGTALQSRWWDHHEERQWVKKTAAAADPGHAAGQQLALARDLCGVMSISWYGFSCMLRKFEEDLDEAEDPDRRPRPESADWWRDRYDGCAGRHSFVHLSPGQVARARELVADASARTQRIRAPREDLERRCWPAGPGGAAAAAADGVLSTPRLLERLRRVQRLADAVLVPLRALKRLVDRLIVVNNAGTRSGRGRSAPPPSREGHPMMRRGASMS